MSHTDSRGDAPRLLVLGDSVAFCRSSAEQHLDEAWPQLLHGSGAGDVRWVRSAGGASSREVLAEARHIASYVGETLTWEAAVIQVGIVDVSPRPFGRRLQALIDRLPPLRRALLPHFPSLTRIRSRPWVSEAAFERNMGSLVDVVGTYCAWVILIEIAHPGSGLEQKLGSFTERVDAYNDVLARIAETRPGVVSVVPTIDADALPPHLLPDGHHLTTTGHQVVADAVATLLTRREAR